MRYAARTDSNHRAIIDALRKIGVVVYDLSRAGQGAPDALCFKRDIGWVPLEIKGPRGRLTAAQRATHAKAPIAVARTVAEALALFRVKA